jgi:hypothetical protein
MEGVRVHGEKLPGWLRREGGFVLQRHPSRLSGILVILAFFRRSEGDCICGEGRRIHSVRQIEASWFDNRQAFHGLTERLSSLLEAKKSDITFWNVP